MDLTCNLIRILDCDFIVELLVDPNLDKTIVRSADFASNLGGSADLYTPNLVGPQEAQARFARARLCLPYNKGRKETLRPK